MKLRMIFLILSFCLFPTVVFGQSSDYQTIYFLDINENEIWANGAIFQTDVACKRENGAVMVPLGAFFSAANFATVCDTKAQQFQADIDGTLFSVDGTSQRIGFGDSQYFTFLPPQWVEGECYVAFQDLSGIMDHDAANGILSFSVGSDFMERIKNHCNRLQQSTRYVFDAKKGVVFRENKLLPFEETIYLHQGSLMLPLRDMMQALDEDCILAWEDETKVVQIQFQDQQITLDTVSQRLFLDGREIYLKQPTEIHHQHVFLSFRDWANLLDIHEESIFWDAERKAALVRIHS